MRLPIAVQLYSLRESMQNDAEGTLIALKNMGYDGVEFAGYGGLTSSEIKAELEKQAQKNHTAMLKAAKEQDYIEAARLRDEWQAILKRIETM